MFAEDLPLEQQADRPRLSPADVRRVEIELARTSAEVAGLSRPALDALGPVLAQAQRETARDLRLWLERSPDCEARYTAQVHRTVLAHLETAFEAIGRLDPAMAAALARAGAAGGELAGRHLVTDVARYSGLFDQAPLHIPLNVARIVATAERELIPRFRTSAARYAGDVAADIRRELAVGIVRRESVSQMIDRLQRLGGPRGPVALRGVAGDRGAVVEHIGEGLFRRYRFWAERVVRTETQRAYNVQLDDGIREAKHHLPDLMRRWDASADLRLCAVCQELHGTTAEVDKAFPGGYTTAPAHPNCRCRVGAWRKEWDDILREVDGTAPPAPTPAPTPAPAPPPAPRRRPTLPPPPPPPLALRPTLLPPGPAGPPTVPPPTAFARVPDAEQWLRAAWPHVTWDLKGVHVDAANELVPELHRLALEWPQVLGRLKYVGTYRTVKAAGPRFRWSPRCYAHATRDGARIGLNPARFGDPAKLRAALVHDVAKGWHPPGTEHLASILTHEWGHQVDNWLQSLTGHSFLAASPDPKLSNVSAILGAWRRRNAATAALSRYALTNAEEGFAEAFASLRYTPAAAQTEFTARLGRLLALARAPIYDVARMPDWTTLTGPERANALARFAEILTSVGLP